MNYKEEEPHNQTWHDLIIITNLNKTSFSFPMEFIPWPGLPNGNFIPLSLNVLLFNFHDPQNHHLG